jgi:hypothetical protein
MMTWRKQHDEKCRTNLHSSSNIVAVRKKEACGGRVPRMEGIN